MNSELDINDIKNQSELVKIRNTETPNLYQMAKDKIRDIQLDTNNNQTAGLTDFIKQYKEQSDRTNKYLLYLTVVTIVIGLLGVIFQTVGLADSNSRIEIIQVEAKK